MALGKTAAPNGRLALGVDACDRSAPVSMGR